MIEFYCSIIRLLVTAFLIWKFLTLCNNMSKLLKCFDNLLDTLKEIIIKE